MTTLYREVKRKANVGERIRIVKAVTATNSYANGDEMTVTARQDIVPCGVHTKEQPVFVYDYEYVVLEPVESANTANLPELLTQFLRENAATVRKFLDEIEAPKASAPAQPKPLTRAAIIAKAKADVAELLRIGGDLRSDLPKGTPLHNHLYTVEFHVNRKKRAVAALVRGDRIYARGIAKCAPGDVFNAEIGKAISLRRALGLPVPDEYINAPQPDEPRVGMTVRVSYDMTHPIRTIERKHATIKNGWWFTNGFWASTSRFTVIDDTDVDYKEAA